MLNEPTTKVDLIVIGDALEAVAIRGVLESFGIEVRCHFIGNVKKFISFLNGEETLEKIVIIACHGDENGMILPELGAEIEKEMPYHKILTATNCVDFLKLHNQIVLNTGCCLGNEKFANSFIQEGATAYIGSEDYIEGNAAAFFAVSFLYFYICKSLPLHEAFIKAKSLDDETDLFKLYQSL